MLTRTSHLLKVTKSKTALLSYGNSRVLGLIYRIGLPSFPAAHRPARQKSTRFVKLQGISIVLHHDMIRQSVTPSNASAPSNVDLKKTGLKVFVARIPITNPTPAHICTFGKRRVAHVTAEARPRGPKRAQCVPAWATHVVLWHVQLL